jgi:hypothetical protein
VGALGFAVARCVGTDAMREGTLQGYRLLIETCTPDEAAFVYYADHDERSPAPVEEFQFIVPVDFELSMEADFRGITSLGSSGLLDGWTAKLRNVTAALGHHAPKLSRPGG